MRRKRVILPENEAKPLLNVTLFLRMTYAQVELAAWVEDYNRERSHSSLGDWAPAAFVAELN